MELESLSRGFLPEASLHLMLLLYVCFRRGWWSDVDQCPLFHEGAVFAEDRPPAGAQGLHATAQDADGGSGEQSGVEDGSDGAAQPNDPLTAPVSAAAGRGAARRRRSQTVATLQYCTTLLSRTMHLRLWRVLVFAPGSMERWFSEALVRLKTREGTRSLHVQLSEGALSKLGLRLAMSVFDSDIAPKVGKTRDSWRTYTEFEVKRDKAITGRLWKFLFHLGGGALVQGRLAIQIAAARLHHFDGPAQAPSLVGTVFTKLEAESMSNTQCRQWLESMCWPLQVWSREILLFLAEGDFREECPRVLAGVSQYSDSFLSTLAIEHVFNYGRDLAPKSRKGSLAPVGLWHHEVYGCRVLSDFSARPPEITQCARAASTGSLPKSVFE